MILKGILVLRLLYIPSRHLQSLLDRDPNSQPFDYESDSLPLGHDFPNSFNAQHINSGSLIPEYCISAFYGTFKLYKAVEAFVGVFRLQCLVRCAHFWLWPPCVPQSHFRKMVIYHMPPSLALGCCLNKTEMAHNMRLIEGNNVLIRCCPQLPPPPPPRPFHFQYSNVPPHLYALIGKHESGRSTFQWISI